MTEQEKIKRRTLLRKKRSRAKIFGMLNRPRITIFKSNKYIYVQAIDDAKGHTLAAASGEKTVKGAQDLGKKFAEILLQKNIKEAVFDRSGYPYHGRIKAFVEALREKGIKI
jgi:large subunit ribosomal protein L18